MNSFIVSDMTRSIATVTRILVTTASFLFFEHPAATRVVFAVSFLIPL